MILSRKAILFVACLLGMAPAIAWAQDNLAPAVRRIASTALLAAQEYRFGIENGRVIAPAEIEEARMFLREAARMVGNLPDEDARKDRVALEEVIELVERTGSPDTVAARVRVIVAAIAERYGVDIEEIPPTTPVLARGAQVYQGSCASCHGVRGAGNGPAAIGLDPPAADLTDADALRDVSPLDFYRRVTIGVAGTAMPSFETRLSTEDRWAAAVYASLLRLPAPEGKVPVALTAFATTARMSDAELLNALGPAAGLGMVAAVRHVQADQTATRTVAVFDEVRHQLDTAFAFLRRGLTDQGRQQAFDAYLTFERVEREVRVKDPSLAGEVEAAFAGARSAPGALPATAVDKMRKDLFALLERAERAVADHPSALNLFVQSLVLLVREGLEAILVVGALVAFLVKTGAGRRRRDIHIGVGVAIGASLLTAVALETIFLISPAQQEALEGATMVLATAMLFYVSYWLLSKMEVAKWNRFVRSRVQEAVSSGSALALASVAFLAVYREGFETVLFYKALLVSGGAGGWIPVTGGAALGTMVLGVTYFVINRFGVKLPLKPFFAVTSAFLYYMAFVFAGKGVAELQEGGLIGTTVVGGPRLPALGIYPTLESFLAQGLLVVLALVAVLWTFWIEPRRLKVTPVLVPDSADKPPAKSPAASEDKALVQSLDRIETDLAEIRAELDRIRGRARKDAGKPAP